MLDVELGSHGIVSDIPMSLRQLLTRAIRASRVIILWIGPEFFTINFHISTTFDIWILLHLQLKLTTFREIACKRLAIITLYKSSQQFFHRANELTL